jgi:hypothetical protein
MDFVHRLNYTIIKCNVSKGELCFRFKHFMLYTSYILCRNIELGAMRTERPDDEFVARNMQKIERQSK